MEKIIEAMKEEEAQLSAKLKLNPTYRRLRSIRALLATYAETGGNMASVGEAGEEQADTLEPATVQQNARPDPEDKVQRFPARRRGVSTPSRRTVRKNGIIDDVAALLAQRGQRLPAKEIIQVMNDKGHEIRAAGGNISNFCNMIMSSGRFNNQRGTGGGYGLRDWPVSASPLDKDSEPSGNQPRVSTEQESSVVPDVPALPVTEEVALEGDA